jgi:hypothetical protein
MAVAQKQPPFEREGALADRILVVRESLAEGMVNRILAKKWWSDLTFDEQDAVLAAEAKAREGR